ncbi:MAG TPA: cyclic pyranopterin monophosphate synthase MoaC [Gammaproteobacteria bacterium]|nr:cyclic pyranopterin monophosphate synthase MoaC [Gammaproteobacteria bacterium]
MSKRLTHFNAQGDAHMVDVGDKPITKRRARAEGSIVMAPETLAMVQLGQHEKGDVLGIARVAGIMGAKRTAELVPLCHPLPLTAIEIDFECLREEHRIHCAAKVETRGQTGVEMEALTAVQIALLTVYDMCKAVDRGMTMTDIRLCEKSGGRSGHWQRED